MPKWELIKAGDLLWQKMGGRYGQKRTFPVKVVSIDHTGGSAEVRWNGNPVTIWRRHDLVKLTRKKPK